jgi:hypothetical protein
MLKHSQQLESNKQYNGSMALKRMEEKAIKRDLMYRVGIRTQNVEPSEIPGLEL